MSKQYRLRINGLSYEVTLLRRSGNSFSFEINGRRFNTELLPTKAPAAGAPRLSPLSKPGRRPTPAVGGKIAAPMPGVVVHIVKDPGSQVQAGETLLVIEAMKMQNNIVAPCSARVKELRVKNGQEVETGQILVVLE